MPLPPRWLRLLRLPRPRRFLYFMSLRTGAEMISLTMLFNKITGFYGLLAILTGFKLSYLQLGMYLYSLVALFLLAVLTPHIRKGTPFHCLALAWFYLLDTVVNTAFTSAFAVTWFLAVSAEASNSGVPTSAPGSEMIEDTAGFTNPKYNVSGVDVIVKPAGGATAGQDAVAYGTAAGAASSAASPNLGHGMGIEESVPSLVVVVVLTLVRIYFILIMMAWARQVVRQSVFSASTSKLHQHSDGAVDPKAENPFAKGKPQGQGWRGRLGRLMVDTGEDYWLGGQPDQEWVNGLDGRFRTRGKGSQATAREREKRAENGAGSTRTPSNTRMGKV